MKPCESLSFRPLPSCIVWRPRLDQPSDEMSLFISTFVIIATAAAVTFLLTPQNHWFESPDFVRRQVKWSGTMAKIRFPEFHSRQAEGRKSLNSDHSKHTHTPTNQHSHIHMFKYIPHKYKDRRRMLRLRLQLRWAFARHSFESYTMDKQYNFSFFKFHFLRALAFCCFCCCRRCVAYETSTSSTGWLSSDT